MSFELFTRRRSRTAGTPKVSISKAGMLSVNAACRKQYLAEAEAVQLLFDATRRLVGIRPAAADAEHTYRFRQGPAGGQISGRAFLGYANLLHSKTMAYDARWDEEARAVVFEVPESNALREGAAGA